MIESPWMTIEQAAAYAHHNEQTIARACRNGELKASQKVRKGRWLIHHEDIDAWVRGDIAEPAPASPRRAS